MSKSKYAASVVAISLVVALAPGAFARGTHNSGAWQYWQTAAANWGTQHCKPADTSGCIPRTATQAPASGSTMTR